MILPGGVRVAVLKGAPIPGKGVMSRGEVKDAADRHNPDLCRRRGRDKVGSIQTRKGDGHE